MFPRNFRNSLTLDLLMHPCLSAPLELFNSVGIKISIEVPMGIENLWFPTQKFQWGWFWSAFFSIQFPMGIKSLANFPVGLKFWGIFPTGGYFLAHFSSGAGGPPGL